ADTETCQVTRSAHGKTDKVIYRGTDNQVKDRRLKIGAKYQYTVTAFDVASNKATTAAAVTATGALTAPLPGQSVTARPHLTWGSVKGASYYNVQLVRNGRILSRWPAKTSLNLRRSWVYRGHRYHLHHGVYRWYVWPGYGKLEEAHYGKL